MQNAEHCGPQSKVHLVAHRLQIGITNSNLSSATELEEIDHEIISTVILPLPLIQEWGIVDNWQKYVYKVLVKLLED